MEKRNIPRAGEFYKHFKGNLYQIVTVAEHTETSEELVVYQALYGDFKTYARPLSMFLSEVDHEKYPLVSAKYRFEQVVLQPEVKSDVPSVPMNEPLAVTKIEPMEIKPSVEASEEGQINPYLLKFLDADSYTEKLQVLEEIKKNMDEKVLHGICIATDIVVEDGDLEEQYLQLYNCIQTHARFESRRLR